MLRFINKILINIINKILVKSNLKNKLTDFIKIQNGIKTILTQEINYKNINSLEEAECKIFSQNGEDGIINYLVKKLKINNPSFVEIGVGDYSEANTRLLYERFHSKGLIFDVIDDFENKVKKNINYWKGDIRAIQKNINSDNFNSLLSANCKFDIDIFSIDIDGVDYWIIEKLQKKISKIFIAEYNANFGSELEITVPNLKNFSRTNYHHSNLCYGMSLKSLIKLMQTKGYYFIGTNQLKNNAFFINDIYKKDVFFPNIVLKNLDYYVDCNIRESRDKDNNLNFLTGKDKLKNIKDCLVVDLSNPDNRDKMKIMDLIEIK
jgi:hypothetical protein